MAVFNSDDHGPTALPGTTLTTQIRGFGVFSNGGAAAASSSSFTLFGAMITILPFYGVLQAT